MTRRLLPWLMLPLLASMLLAWTVWFRSTEVRSVPPEIAGSLWPVARPLDSVVMPRVDGGKLGAAEFQGRWTLVYFGYLQCPDICPTTLGSMVALKRRIKADPIDAAVPRLVFVSVDPEHDTAEAIAGYAGYFDPEIVGIRAEPDALKSIAQTFGVFYEEQVDDRGVRSVSHTTSVLLVDPAGQSVAAFSATQELRLFERQYRQVIAYLSPKTGS